MLNINGEFYNEIPESEFERRPDDTEDAHIERIETAYAKATHWLCEETWDYGDVTAGKLYPFRLHESGLDHVVKTDSGDDSTVWIGVPGKLLIKAENKN